MLIPLSFLVFIILVALIVWFLRAKRNNRKNDE